MKISKHLAYLKEKGVVAATRHQNWMIYDLPAKPSRELERNLKCLQDCVQTEPIFKKDQEALKAIRRDVKWVEAALDCCARDATCGKVGKKSKTRGGAACR